ncbi:MAG: hypothetical protein D6798_00850 [Deltaproteobacteria bacterium]|nr:MAG: hypothetical protein D6798_00850 [Deltaproteobacteria bacterium]
MDLTTLLTILRRRWYVAAPVLLVGLVGALLGGGRPSYTVEANFLLVAPVVGADGAASNALLENSSGVNAVASVAVVVVESEASRADVAAAGYSADYDFRVARNEPFVTLVVEAHDPDLAVGTTLALSRLFLEEIADQQLRFGVASGSLVHGELLDVDEPTADYTGVRLRQALVVAAAALLAGLAAIATEGWAYTRRIRTGTGAGATAPAALEEWGGDGDDHETGAAADAELEDLADPSEPDPGHDAVSHRGWRRRPVRVPAADGDDDPDGDAR